MISQKISTGTTGTLSRTAAFTRGRLAAVAGLAAAGAIALTMAPATAAFASASAATAAGVTDLYVNPATGSDSAAGTSTAPFATIQQAMNVVQPGTTVHLAAGTYSQNVTTKTDGTPSARITITGPSSGTARLFGTGHVMAIRNSYYTLQDFSIDGQQAIEAQTPVAQWPTTPTTVASFKDSTASIAVNDRLVYIDSGSATTAVTGTTLTHMMLTGAGGECVRVRNSTTATTIQNSVIRYCGLYPVPLPGDFTYHNGEGVYVGTSPKSTTLAGYQNDQTSATLLTSDTITTYGSECLDVKENAHNNTLASSTCAGNLEPLTYSGSMIELRGYSNTITKTTIADSAGYGIKIASDTPATDHNANTITSNTFRTLTGGSLSNKSAAPAAQICGNTISTGATPGDFTTITTYAKSCPTT